MKMDFIIFNMYQQQLRNVTGMQQRHIISTGIVCEAILDFCFYTSSDFRRVALVNL